MTLRVVGAGVGRTGTESLKLALERLLGGPCYHMLEVMKHPETFGYWRQAGRDDFPDWDQVFAGYVACVDWPAAAYWPEISAKYPDAIVLLSTRATAAQWFKSASETIFATRPATESKGVDNDFRDGLMRRFTMDFLDPASAMAAYEAHNQRVRETVPADRLVEWQPGDGWGPLCTALNVPEPDEPFPHVNTTEMFKQRMQGGPPSAGNSAG